MRCWLIKPPNYRWSSTCTKRLAQIRASGGTPLAEIYGLLEPIVRSFKPEIFFTLTDGEPSDTDAVRHMVLSFRKIGTHMVALGLGRNLDEVCSDRSEPKVSRLRKKSRREQIGRHSEKGHRVTEKLTLYLYYLNF